MSAPARHAPAAATPAGSAPDAGAWTAFTGALAARDLTYLVEVELGTGGATRHPGGIAARTPAGAPPAGRWVGWADVEEGEATLRFSDREYVSRPTDTPAATRWRPRLTRPLRLTRSVQLAPAVPTDGAAAATIELANPDGGLDATVAGARVAGRRVTVLAGRQEASRATFRPVWTGVADAWEADGDGVRLTARDASRLLEVDLPSSVYGGTGGLDGTAEMAGRAVPLLAGSRWNVPAVPVDPTALIYQVSDGRVHSIAVWSGGAAIAVEGDTADLTTGTTTAGYARTDLGRGLFQLGSQPNKPVTATVEGDAPGGAYADRIGTILYRLLKDRAGISARWLDRGSFDLLDGLVPAACGLWLDRPVPARRLLTETLAGVGCHWVCRRDGRIAVRRLFAPAPTAASRTFTTSHILDLRRLPLPEAIGPATWRWRIRWRQNDAVLRETDLSGLAADRAAELGAEWSTAIDFDSAVRGRHRRPADPDPVPSVLQDGTAAKAIATAMLELHGADRQLLEVTVPATGQAVQPGDTVVLVWPRLGLGSGRAFRAFPVDEDAAQRTVTLLCWG